MVDNGQSRFPKLYIVQDNLGIGGQQLFNYRVASYFFKENWEISCSYAERQIEVHDWESRWKNLGECIPLKGHGSIRQIQDWLPNIYNLKRICKHISDTRPDVILTGSSWTRLMGGIAGKLYGVPVVNIPGSVWHLSWYYRFFSWILGPIHACRGYISFGKKMHLDYLGLGVDEKRIIHTHHGTELDLFKPNVDTREKIRRTLGFSEEDLVLGYGGRLDPVKGLSTIIDVFKGLENDRLPWKLLFVGDGPEREKLLTKAQSLGLESKVRITGFVENVNEYYAALDCAIQYSSVPHGGVWNLGTFTVEAMASGVPILHYIPAEICGGYDEGVCGFFVDCAENPGMLGERLKLIGRQPEVLSDMGKAARLFAVNNYDINDTMKKIAEGIEAIIG